MPRLGTYLLVSINIYVDKMMHWELVADRTLRNKDVYLVLSNDTTVPLSHTVNVQVMEHEQFDESLSHGSSCCKVSILLKLPLQI